MADTTALTAMVADIQADETTAIGLMKQAGATLGELQSELAAALATGDQPAVNAAVAQLADIGTGLTAASTALGSAINPPPPVVPPTA